MEIPPDLKGTYARLKQDSERMIGYPGTRIVDFSPLYPFMDFFINNIGDPYTPGSYRINTHGMEREVIAWFRKILHADGEGTWGYVTGGGTEGNMYGIYLAREALPGGTVYYSEDTHYSVPKILRIINAHSVMIRSRPDGEINYADLDKAVAANRGSPPIIFANIGTTMRGAIDDLDKIKSILKERAVQQHYIHADAALSGMILPFTDAPQPFDFSAGIDSISISGHKMPGIPFPCGVVLAKQEHVNRIARAIEYVGANDTTVAGSRNGMAPLFLRYLIDQTGEDEFRKIVKTCMDTADYAIAQFSSHGIDAWRHRNSLTVVFPWRPGKALEKWQLARQGGEAHLIAMPHVGRKHIDGFMQDYLASFPQAQRARD
jgi:histidine decarboxylase